MAKYKITALNYINVGTNRVFFNIDTKLPYQLTPTAFLLSTEISTSNGSRFGDIRTESEYNYLSTDFIQTDAINSSTAKKPVSEESNISSIILTERQKYVEELDPDKGEIIRLFKSINTEEFYIKMEEFNRKTEKHGNIFVGEFSPVNSQEKNIFDIKTITGVEEQNKSTNFHPMYDIRDVSIKSKTNLSYTNKRIDAEDSFQNVFIPDMSNTPLGFCKIQNGGLVDTVMMTTHTGNDPYMLRSSLVEQRNKEENTSYYEMLLNSSKTNTFLYPSHKQLGYNNISTFLSSSMDFLSVFEPSRSIIGVDRNYILDFPDSEIPSEYETGNVHAEIYPGKNPLNALYSMQISADDSLWNSRRYCGIGQNSNMVYLKFYDSVNYRNGGSVAKSQISGINGVRTESDLLPYQKIEYFINNKFTNKCKHKSNLFSIKIHDLDSLSESSMQSEESQTGSASKSKINNVSKIRDDLYCAIQEIVKNVCPVNTQLFKIQFGGDN